MNAELPPVKNGEHNSESATTIDSVIIPLTHFRNCLLRYSTERKNNSLGIGK